MGSKLKMLASRLNNNLMRPALGVLPQGIPKCQVLLKSARYLHSIHRSLEVYPGPDYEVVIRQHSLTAWPIASLRRVLMLQAASWHPETHSKHSMLCIPGWI